MDAALERCYQGIPATSLKALRPPTGSVALRCTLPQCGACREFKESGRRAAFERSLSFKERVRVVPWDCSDAHRRALAQRAGVGDLPAYVILSSSRKKPVRVVAPE